MYFSCTESELPELELLPQNELALIVKELLSKKHKHFSFQIIVREFAEYIARTRKGFDASANTEYVAKLNEQDVTRIREVIWDLIIERYLTPGGYQDDTWAQLTISERGVKYFHNYGS
jgi:hypothetical protein